MSDATAAPGPLAEADPKSLDYFFSMDPLDMKDTDLAVIVEEFRRQRAQWAENEAKAAAEGKKPGRAAGASAAAKTAAAVATLNTSVDDLFAMLEKKL